MRIKKAKNNNSIIYSLLGFNEHHIIRVEGKILMVKEAGEAFMEMRRTAEKDGVKMRIVSSYRSFEKQREIWNRKLTEFLQKYSMKRAVEEVLKYTAFPGISRHHWGTEIDLAGETYHPDPLQNSHFKEGGIYRELYTWLEENASSFGFYQVYIDDKKSFPACEMWHWSYAPLSIQFLQVFMEEFSPEFLKGKKIVGDEFVIAHKETYINGYLFSINPVLKPQFKP